MTRVSWTVAGVVGAVATVAVSLAATQATGPGGSALETLNYARFYAGNDPNVIYACQNTNGTPCSGAVQAPGTNWTVNYFSDSQADFGVLRANASVFLTGDDLLGPFPSFASIGGRAGFRDTLTVTGGSGAATLVFVFQVTGTSGATPGANGRPQFQWVPVVNGVPNFGAQRNYAVSAGGTAVVSFPIVFNTPTPFAVYFYALAQVFSWLPGASAFADYDSTAILVHVGVTDSAGQTVDDFQVQSASGTTYETDGIVQTIAIDVKPDVKPEEAGTPAINTRSNGMTTVAILSSASFDAIAVVDRTSLTFGGTGLEHSVQECAGGDVNADGLPDLVCRSRTELLGLLPGATLVRLQGFTVAGIPIGGADQVRVVW